MEFVKFKIAVSTQFARMKDYPLFRTQVDGDTMWNTYLSSFPPGTNPIFRKRAEYDCSACRRFIRAVGNVVAIIDNDLVSIWDAEIGDPNYQIVSNALSELVKSAPVENVFLHTEKTAGVDKNFEQIMGNVATWEHFFINIPQHNFCLEKDIGTELSETKALHDVMYRSLTELTDDAVDTVLELIAQRSLHRGEEHQHAVKKFKELKAEFDSQNNKDLFVWTKIKTVPTSVAKIRNTAMGTLLIDLSEGKDLEKSVTAFEKIMGGENYKRPTAVATTAMVEKAKKRVEEKGLTSALPRRYAGIADININDILFADRKARKAMTGDVFDEIAASVGNKKPKMDKVEEVPIDKFIKDILPLATSIEIMPENSHIGNLVSLIAPVDPTAGRLFKWPNNFSWAYNGDVADSIKERVKRAGGNVTGDLCCRLAWSNYDDLDFHMVEPGGYEIFYQNKQTLSPNGGMLDVDKNAGGRETREPVENIFYQSRSKMKEGTYSLRIHQFHRRESIDVGFEVEVDFLGQTWHFAYDKPVRQDQTITVMEFTYTHRDGIKVINSLPASTLSKTIWSIATNYFHKVNVLMMSPNHWEGSSGIGNKHYFFMLEGCVNPDEARGFFNEFLREDLNEDRKVFEILGSKMRAPFTDNQLSGLGFSSTKRNSVLCRVSGSFTRTLKITF